MTTFIAYFKKEHMEFTRTYKFLILGFIALFFALSSPIVLYFTPKILATQFDGSFDFATLMQTSLKTSFFGYMDDVYQILFVIMLFFGLAIFNNERVKYKNVLPKMAGATDQGIYAGKIVYIAAIMLFITYIASFINYAYGYFIFPKDLTLSDSSIIILGYYLFFMFNIALLSLFSAIQMKKFFIIFITLIHYYAVPPVANLFKLKVSPYHLINHGVLNENYYYSLIITGILSIVIILLGYFIHKK
ncbi:MAG: hypothetical protein JXR88_13225 [Clostridia bacterium]|nr:hypothetical protein [Clostridia bacterium]